LHFPSGHPAWALPSTLPCGVRTFLGISAAIARRTRRGKRYRSRTCSCSSLRRHALPIRCPVSGSPPVASSAARYSSTYVMRISALCRFRIRKASGCVSELTERRVAGFRVDVLDTVDPLGTVHVEPGQSRATGRPLHHWMPAPSSVLEPRQLKSGPARRGQDVPPGGVVDMTVDGSTDPAWGNREGRLSTLPPLTGCPGTS